MCVKCLVNRELSSGRKGFLRYMIRIPLLHIMVIYFYTSYVERNYCKGGIFFMAKIFWNFCGFCKRIQKSEVSYNGCTSCGTSHCILQCFLSIQVTEFITVFQYHLSQMWLQAVFLDLLWVLSAVELVI